MNTMLICPSEREAVRALSQQVPLSNLPAFGKALVIHWLEYLATLGIRSVSILAADRPEQVRALVGDGSRWGLRIEVFPETRELSPDEARERYLKGDTTFWPANPNDANVIDHFPEFPEKPLFNSYADWFAGMVAFMPVAAHRNQVGFREAVPGVWVGPRARIAPDAQLIAPCWIGSNVVIGAHCVIGPSAFIEDRVMIESAVEISDSAVAPETFVGSLVELKNSLAHGRLLINWQTASATTVPDTFLLSSLAERKSRTKPGGILGRLCALLALIVTLPLALVPFLKSKFRNQRSLRALVAVCPHLDKSTANLGHPRTSETMVYYELANCKGWLRFWPQLWNIARGEFVWVGNRPLSPAAVAKLTNDFERLWLAAPIGLISLAHAEGIADAFSDEARACASFYAVQANWRLDMSILARTFFVSPKRALASIF